VWTEGNEQVVNSYWPIKVPSARGNPGPFLDHLSRILPVKTDQDILMAYMAAVVQHKGIKFQWSPLLQGTRGNGKTLFTRCLINAVGRQHCHSPKANEISEKFNDWLENKIFIGIEDIYVPKEKREVLEILKPMITSNWQEIRGMRRDKVARFVCANFMLNSNHKDAIRMTDDNRGICIFFTAQQSVRDLKRYGMDGNYFPKLYRWLDTGGYAIVTNYLQNYKIPDELNPASNCHRAPYTSSTMDAIAECKGTLEQEIEAAILEERVGFRKGWVSSYFLDILIKDLGGMRIPRNKRTEILDSMGYIRHPGFKHRGQSSVAVSPDGQRSVLYIEAKHSSINLSGVDAARAYEKDQNSS
jgi:hypothetical protein